ncbi:DUF3313 domain-containing protein [Trinickia caryophylli]|uniref:DUF3313 domain-containing protein n=1 Tax=Trinickia caryophylli TaxID=28094 RepID=A0A1X7H7Y5_TRICW|nr:DUF3313 domain-containing protein [Trinickia caryophylli]PMS09451.1 DUF3313 domain-containing protein [Trinickia caryophylli]TRX14119.1 DUF3313 domain-containing protein [Trinickia caryophylli]WQE13938.1 DUF3313 domain-containing protein [Trinickia caryophylli]SMF81093.1 Protein of unknown function [Trinickia caryophylli]GLU35717.1 lipoprotein [Trinickia caryophylli]
MLKKNSVAIFLSAAAALTLTACAGVQPVAYSGISSSPQMTRNAGDNSGKVPYQFTAPVVWSRYTKVIVDPVVIYQGADNQFGDIKSEDRSALASYMGKTFSGKLATRFSVVQQPGPNTLRVKLTLTGAEKTTALVGQFMHFDLAGNLYNGVQSIRGGQGAFSGSVSYAVEVYDSVSGQLLKAYVSKQYPNAMNLPAAFGSLGAAKTGIDKGADALVAEFH